MIYRKQRYISRIGKVFSKYGKNAKTREQIQLIIFLGYIKFVKELSQKSQFMAHEERTRKITPRHIRKAERDILERMQNSNHH